MSEKTNESDNEPGTRLVYIPRVSTVIFSFMIPATFPANNKTTSRFESDDGNNGRNHK